MGNRAGADLVIAAAAALLLAGLFEAYGEISPYFTAGYTADTRFGAISSGAYRPGASLSSKDLFFSDCIEVAESLYARAQPTERRNTFLERCAAEAQAATAAMPSYVRGWLVLAGASAQLGRAGGLLAALARAQAVAPDVAWVADRRVTLALAYRNKLDAASQVGLDRDIAVLLESLAGARALAARYVEQPDLRDYLIAIAEQAPQPQQRRFLNEVEKAGTP